MCKASISRCERKRHVVPVAIALQDEKHANEGEARLQRLSHPQNKGVQSSAVQLQPSLLPLMLGNFLQHPRGRKTNTAINPFYNSVLISSMVSDRAEYIQ